MFKVLVTQSFIKELKQLFNKIEIEKFNLFKEKLKQNSYLGDQLRVPFVREFKSKGKRAYFIVNSKSKKIIFIACSNKKNQNYIINEIFLNLVELIKLTN
ncbi:MAG: hypothetical protein LAT82_05470 [Nanoarchaeota archaeon]|nr:hypothetical protein [Nanoarchaeota archaeon]